jgi:putative ABC transport system permease protein
MIKDALQMTWKNFRNRKVRSLLTILGIVIGVATIVALISIGQGLQNAITEQFQKLGTRNLFVVPGGSFGPPTEGFSLSQDTADYIDSIPGVDYVNSILIRSTTVTYGREDQFLTVWGQEPEIAERSRSELDIRIAEGRDMQKGDRDAAVIGHKVAYDTFEEEIKIRTSIVINGRTFKVIGILEETGGDTDSNVLIPLDVARELFNAPTEVNYIVVTINEGINIYDMETTIAQKLDKRLGEDTYDIYTPDQILDNIGEFLGVIQAVLVSIAAISIIVGAVGIMNSMYTSVMERTREIGVMKSIGAGNGQVMTIFLIEAGLVGLAGGVIGVIIGLLMAKATEIGAKLGGFMLLSVRIDPMVVLLGLGIAVIIGMISGFFPALRASRLKPVEALRYE